MSKRVINRGAAMASLILLAACQPAGQTAQSDETASAPREASEAPADAAAERQFRDGLSTYTQVDIDACEEVDRQVEGESVTWRCPGSGGIELWAHIGDGRMDLDAGNREGGWAGIGPFNTLGPTVEWRGPAGVPYAIIYRLRSATSEAPGLSWLVVETIGTHTQPGCVVARIDGGVPDANARAREAADTWARGFVCDRDEPSELTALA